MTATTTKKYFRIMLGKGSRHAQECLQGNYIGMDFDIREDLSPYPDSWEAFKESLRPKIRATTSTTNKIAAGLVCGHLYPLAKSMRLGDIVLCPDGQGSYLVGEITSDYSHHPDTILPHRRSVRWYSQRIDRADMSHSLKMSTGSAGTVCRISKYAEEIEELIGEDTEPTIISTDETIEDPTVFALEKHLEEFLVRNWQYTELGRNYDIFEMNGEVVGQQFRTETGYIDILAINNERKEYLIVELKKGRASDAVVGQVQRYMGDILEEVAEEGYTVKGVIIALEDDLRIRRALAVAPNIDFYRYEVQFRLFRN